MKKLCIILAFCLILCGCAKEEPEKPTEADTEPSLQMTEEAPLKAVPQENSAWQPYAQYSDKMGLVLNEPVENPPKATTVWIEGEYECAYIIPRYVGSYVNLYMLEWGPDFASYTLADEPDFSTLAGDGCVIYTVLPRPEGIPMWYLEIVKPDGSGDGYVLEYNGNTGTPAIEFFQDKS